ncbi:MAG: molybdenum cofactor biosynthesis protein MoaE [Anaerolineae bacterium]
MFLITDEPLKAADVEEAVARPDAGAIVTFQGVVRDNNLGKQVSYLVYEAYPPMAEKVMAQIGDEIAARWPGAQTAIAHRVGKLEIGEASVIIAVSTGHRADAFDACHYAIDRLKAIVPVWKKEVWEGGEYWIEGSAPASEDEAAAVERLEEPDPDAS